MTFSIPNLYDENTVETVRYIIAIVMHKRVKPSGAEAS